MNPPEKHQKPVPERDTPPPFPELLARFRDGPRALLGRIPGFVVIDKPGGTLTSHDVVARARRAFGERRVGHAGTLDPMASGVLLLLLGSATRLFDECQRWPKSYRARFRLGRRTDTQDRTGAPLDAAIWTPSRLPPLQADEVEAALAAFRGDISQTPPMYSALKKNGKPLHAYARQGVEVERKPRPARVERLELEDFDGESGTLSMTVGSGFYVRTLIDDLGTALGTGAYMDELERTAVGPFTRADAWPL